MSDRQQENASRIAAYLDNKLSPLEREAFKRALSEDDELRLQYIDALMNRAGTGEAPAPGEPAEEKGPGAGDASGHGGGDVADEWLGIVRGAEGARDGGDPQAAGNAAAAGAVQGGDSEAGHGGTRDVLGETGAAGMGELEEIVREGGIGEREEEGTGREAWGAARNWGSAEDPTVHGVTDASGDRGPGGEGNTRDLGSQGENREERGSMATGGERDEIENTASGGARDGGGTREWEGKWEQETDGPGGTIRGKTGFFGSRWMVILSLFLLVIAAVVVIMMVRRQGFWDRSVAFGTSDSGRAAASNGRPDSAKSATGSDATTPENSGKAATGGAGTGTGTGTAGGTGGGSAPLADSMFARLYKPYIRGDDPQEVRKYYQDYRAGNYDAVLAVGDSTGLGVGKRKVLIRDYMRLYRGLSLLATGNPKDAVPELEGVVLRTKPGDILYETARWYLALAWLKRNDVDPAEAKSNALGLARDVSHGYSRYSEPARQLIRDLAP